MAKFCLAKFRVETLASSRVFMLNDMQSEYIVNLHGDENFFLLIWNIKFMHFAKGWNDHAHTKHA